MQQSTLEQVGVNRILSPFMKFIQANNNNNRQLKRGCYSLGQTSQALQPSDKSWESWMNAILNKPSIKIFKYIILNADFMKLNQNLEISLQHALSNCLEQKLK